MTFKIVIPARFDSTRLPGKPLIEIAGIPMVIHVARKARLSGAEEVIIATDDERILDVAIKNKFDGILTHKDHPSGSDRILEVAKTKSWDEDTIIINVQGDEPLIDIEAVNELGDFMHANKYKYGTIARHFSSNADLLDPNKVKVIINDDNSALEFFRDTPVVVKDFSKLVLHHLGIYAYQVDFLNTFSGLSKTENEISLKLEQMRALDNGLPLHVLELNLDESWGIDTKEDLIRLRSHLKLN